VHMRETILNLPTSSSANIHRSMLEMRKNECMKDMDTKDTNDPIKDPIDAGRRNNARREDKTWGHKTKNKIKTNDNVRCGKRQAIISDLD